MTIYNNKITGSLTQIVSYDSNTAEITGINLASTTGNTELGDVANVKITGGTSGQVLSTDGAGNLSFTNATSLPGGANGQVQFNANGALAGNANLTFDSANGILATNNLTANIVGVGTALNTPLLRIGNSSANVPLAYANSQLEIGGNASANVIDANVINVGDITATDQVNLGAVGNITITGGSNGQFLSTNGSGDLTWTDPLAFSNIPAISWTYTGSQATSITLSNDTLANYASNAEITLFHNGVLVLPNAYTLSGNTLTVNVPTNPDDTFNVPVSSLAVANASDLIAGTNQQLQFNDNGVLGGANVLWNKGSNVLTINGTAVINDAPLAIYGDTTNDRLFIRAGNTNGVANSVFDTTVAASLNLGTPNLLVAPLNNGVGIANARSGLQVLANSGLVTVQAINGPNVATSNLLLRAPNGNVTTSAGNVILTGSNSSLIVTSSGDVTLIPATANTSQSMSIGNSTTNGSYTILNTSNASISGMRLNKNGAERWFIGADATSNTGNFSISGPTTLGFALPYLSLINTDNTVANSIVTTASTSRKALYRANLTSIGASENWAVLFANQTTTIPSFTHNNTTGTFTNTSNVTRKFALSFQCAITAQVTNFTEADIWFSLNSTYSGTNRRGQQASVGSAAAAMMSTTWTVVLNPNDFFYCYTWADQAYEIGKNAFGADLGYSCILEVVEL